MALLVYRCGRIVRFVKRCRTNKYTLTTVDFIRPLNWGKRDTRTMPPNKFIIRPKRFTYIFTNGADEIHIKMVKRFVNYVVVMCTHVDVTVYLTDRYRLLNSDGLKRSKVYPGRIELMLFDSIRNSNF